jgi:dTDP-4-amino-4,6-dideoxygalactose transaminase
MISSALALDADIERVPFSDLSPQWWEIADGARADIDTLFASGSFRLGPFVEGLRAASPYLGVRRAVGVNSGTAALHLALIAAGVRFGDKVLVPANTDDESQVAASAESYSDVHSMMQCV